MLRPRFCIAPLDVVKIRLQLQTHSLRDPAFRPSATLGGPVYTSTLHTLAHILRAEGIRGLWKGNVPAECLYVCYGGTQFLAYRTASRALAALPAAPPPALASFAAGAAAGTAATALTYPLDLLRTRFAAQGEERVYASLRAAVREIYAHEGWRGFFRGLGAAVGQVVPYMGLFFAGYEALRLGFAGVEGEGGGLGIPWGLGDAAAGVCASVAAKTAVFPLDTVRKRLQVQGPTRGRYVHRNIPEYRGVLGTLKAVVKVEGPRGLYRGLPVSLIKAAPASAVTMWTYERALGLMVAVSRDEEDE